MSTDPCCQPCDFTEPDVSDSGCCKPVKILISCEAPVKPVPACPDEEITTEFDPETGIFSIIGELLDENCLPVLDENNLSIMTRIS